MPTTKQTHIERINATLNTSVQNNDRIEEVTIKQNESVELIESKEPFESTESTVEEKICPRCGQKLVLRVAKKGDNAGNQFYGCSAYPKCRYIAH